MFGIMNDDNGNPSSGRYMAVGALLVAAVLAIVPLFSCEEPADNSLVLYFLMAAFGGKVGQKFAENLRKPQ